MSFVKPSMAILRSLTITAIAVCAAMTAFVAGAQASELPDLERGRKLLLTDPPAAFELAQAVDRKVDAMSSGQDRLINHAATRWLMAEAKLRVGDLATASQLVQSSLSSIATVSGPLLVRGDLLLTQGGIDSAQSNTAQALNHYQEAYRTFAAIGDPRRQAIALSCIASLYREGRDFASSEKYFRQAAEIYAGDPLIELSMRNNRGNVLRQMERFDDAISEYQRALTLADKLNSDLLRVRVYTNIARNQLEKGDLPAGEETLRRALAMSATGEARSWRPQVLALMANAAFMHKDYAGAGRLIGQAFAGVDPNDVPASLRDAHDIAYEIYAKLGDTKKALQHLEAVRELNIESAKVATSTNAALMAARFDYQNQELRIARLRADELRNKINFERAQADAERALFIAIVCAVAVVIAMLSYGVIRLRKSRNQVRAANIELGETNRALEKALAAKTEFLATTSHEIRTPLNGILGMTQVMLADGRIEGSVRERINVVHGAGVTMKALVDDILDVAKMETGNMTVEAVPMDLVATLHDVARMWEEQARARGLSFELDVTGAPGWIECDPSRLRQIVFNLLSNALKFTEAGGVTLAARSVVGGGAPLLELEVRDTGIGIPPEKLEEVFESFKQVDAGTTRKFGGTGLGLAICRNLARALGGDIRLSSQLGKGSSFTVMLPLIRCAAPEGVMVAADGKADDRGLIVVDRNPIARGMLKTLFEPHTNSLRFAGDVDEAAAMITAGGAACVLIDAATLALAGDPIPQITQITQLTRAANMCTAVLWVRPTAEDVAAIDAAGADRCIAKPIGGAALVKAVFGDGSEIKGEEPLVSRAA